MNAPARLPQIHAIPEYESPIPETNEDLCKAITRLAGHINAAEHRFLTLLAALVERDAWHGAGFKTPAHWLNYFCGIDLGAAREKVRVAKCLADLPQIDETFRRGGISYSKVRAMTRVATPDNEDYLLYIARQGTAQHMEMLVRKYQRVQRIATEGRERDKCLYDNRELTWHFDDDGMLVVRARLTPEDGAAFLKNLEAFTDQESPEPETTFPQKRADALAAMADQAVSNLDDDIKPATSADKYQVMVHIERDKTEHVSAETCSGHRGTLECGDANLHLSPDTLKRLACDASIVPVEKDSEGNALNVGRKTRTIPPAIRRALTLRDSHCRFPGCCQTRFLDAHHIKHWCDGGETSLDNLVLLCRHHHRVLHQEGYTIMQDNTGNAVFVMPTGRHMPDTLSPQFLNGEDDPGKPAAIEADNERLGVEIDAETAVTAWRGESMDYGLAVSALMDYDAQIS